MLVDQLPRTSEIVKYEVSYSLKKAFLSVSVPLTRDGVWAKPKSGLPTWASQHQPVSMEEKVVKDMDSQAHPESPAGLIWGRVQDPTFLKDTSSTRYWWPDDSPLQNTSSAMCFVLCATGLKREHMSSLQLNTTYWQSNLNYTTHARCKVHSLRAERVSEWLLRKRGYLTGTNF